jgi:hypothetical protein
MPTPVRARRFAAPRGLPLPNRTLRVLREGCNLKRLSLAIPCFLIGISRGRRFAPLRSCALGRACYANCQGSGSAPGGTEVAPRAGATSCGLGTALVVNLARELLQACHGLLSRLPHPLGPPLPGGEGEDPRRFLPRFIIAPRIPSMSCSGWIPVLVVSHACTAARTTAARDTSQWRIVPAKSAISSRRSWHSGSNRSTFRFNSDTWNPLAERCSRTLRQSHIGSEENSAVAFGVGG